MNMTTKYFFVFVIFVNIWSPTTADFFDWIDDKIQPLSSPADKELFEEALMDMKEICKKYGYDTELHTAHTSDGYNLNMYRLLGKTERQSNSHPILLMHGNSGSSRLWLDGAQYNIAFFLADNGYDVWMGNFRGNPYTSHEKYSKESKYFWNFSLDELVAKDVPSMVNTILEQTKAPKIVYVGISMGTTVGFAFLSSQTTYHPKIAGFVALSPVANLRYIPHFIVPLMLHAEEIGDVFELFGIHKFLYLPPKILKILQHLCPVDNPSFCGNMLDAFGGFDPYLRNNTRNFVYSSHLQNGESVKLLKHHSQIYKKNGFYKYDYGSVKNLRVYNSRTPPEYDYHQIKVPVFLVYGANDVLADPVDIALASRKLPNLLGMKLVDNAMFTHGDMAYAMNNEELYYNDVLVQLKKMFN